MIDQIGNIRKTCDRFMRPAVMKCLSKYQHNEFSITAYDHMISLRLTDDMDDLVKLQKIVVTKGSFKYGCKIVKLIVLTIHKETTRKIFVFYTVGYYKYDMQGSNKEHG